ncbi:glucosamine-6-phosphate deaminase [Pedobacter africanus]|uniref:Glucosamine-6-phosphate deaminase n=1 Tax=Pedobacter africanus TaxID=151894 RepID=A0ACC6KS46_9SPHI|nr:glucosamine-6-phosphate deaminase [Pedobacter africanus]MDR6781980.1 glucosamine-6-phosphate deaminase [Pedobacter africanus]
MKISIKKDNLELGAAAGTLAAQMIRSAIAEKGNANIILATGTSQFETLNQLIREQDIDWGKVTMFHLDEYIGLPETAAASFRSYLKERFLMKVPALAAVYLIDGETAPGAECERLAAAILGHPIDVALVGIGENGHLAFNDPPADFDTEVPYIVVSLDENCRKQQLGEGWFPTLNDVPRQAISMSVRQIMKSKCIICSVPDSRKAEAVKNSLKAAVSNSFPASILQLHPDCHLYLDSASAQLISAN